MFLAFLIFGCILLFETVRTHLMLAKYINGEAPTKRLKTYPPVTVVRPIKGVDYGIEENVRAALDDGYPGEVETIFVFHEESDPAYQIVKEIVEEYKKCGGGRDVWVLFSGQPTAKRTGKLHSMILGLSQAKGELIAFADSDTRADRGTLRKLVETLAGWKGAGSAFAPVVVTEPPETIGDVGYAFMLNSLYTPVANMIARKSDGSFPFVMGQFMIFKREAIEAIGGLECAEGQLVDDMYLGMRLYEKGYHNVMASHFVPIIQKNMPIAQFMRVCRRWLAFSRTGLPITHDCRLIPTKTGIVFWLGLLGSIFAAISGHYAASFICAAVPIYTGYSIWRLHQLLGGGEIRSKHMWVSMGVLLNGLITLFLTIIIREVEWRGSSYKLDVHARLAESEG